MKTSTHNNMTLLLYPSGNPKLRKFALWYFACFITAWSIVGHLFLGFENSWAQTGVSLGSALAAQYFLEWVDAKAAGRAPRYRGSLMTHLEFIPPAVIVGFAVAMLLMPSGRLIPMAFCSVLAISSKPLLRAPMGKGTQHFLNPSNAAVAFTLIVFSKSLGPAPPYQFTANVDGALDWIIPLGVLVSGIVVHAISTGRLALITAWLVGFAVQGVVRVLVHGLDPVAPFAPVLGTGFIIFTLYMIPDPATTPLAPKKQVIMGLAVAAAYAILLELHLPYGLFFALTVVACLRGLGMYVTSWVAALRTSTSPEASPPVAELKVG